MLSFLSKLRGGMSAAEAISKSAAGDLVVIDIREPGEIAQTGYAQGALTIPASQLSTQANPNNATCHPSLKLGKPIALYCVSGARSAMVKGRLKQMGHTEVHNIGGLGHWQRAGGPVVW
ncbi:MAG: sulfurtransferase [Pelagimonas sp.]